jgi:hypothetical protein
MRCYAITRAARSMIGFGQEDERIVRGKWIGCRRGGRRRCIAARRQDHELANRAPRWGGQIRGRRLVRDRAHSATTLAFARDNMLSITTAGLRHSMGGQAFRKGGIVLDMRGFNRIVLNESARPAQDIDDRETSQVLRYHGVESVEPIRGCSLKNTLQPSIASPTSATSSGSGRDPSRRRTGQGNAANHA